MCFGTPLDSGLFSGERACLDEQECFSTRGNVLGSIRLGN